MNYVKKFGKFASLARRLLAILYDAILLIATLLVATALYMLLVRRAEIAPGDARFNTYLCLVIYSYFVTQWHHGGQTLGMRCWRLRLQKRDASRITWWDASLRFVAAIFSWLPAGLGFFWVLIDRDGLAWHDRWSETILVDDQAKRAQCANTLKLGAAEMEGEIKGDKER